MRNSLKDRPRHFRCARVLEDAPVVAASTSRLWSGADTEENWILTAGKVENLRRATSSVNGLVVPANSTFSFWEHIGRPSARRGFVIGREIQEGCIVPAIAGGLCQLSNALYDAATKAGFEIVERHRHTRVIPGSLAEQDRDATVKWNYLDLRFRSSRPFRIEVTLTTEDLNVVLRSPEHGAATPDRPAVHQPHVVNDCYTCGNTSCFRHPGVVPRRTGQRTAFILDENWPEYEHYVRDKIRDNDHIILPFRRKDRLRIRRLSWPVQNESHTTLAIPAVLRSLLLRFRFRKQNVFSAMLRGDRFMARRIAKIIPLDATHLIVSQNLLPFLRQAGALGGRTYDVLMTRTPLYALHHKLDDAYELFPESGTLRDFRAPAQLVSDEQRALTEARSLITPHLGIQSIYPNKTTLLNWHVPQRKKNTIPGRAIVFPGPAVGRKGAYEVRRLARELGLALRVGGSATEHAGFWEGVAVERAEGDLLAGARLIISPSYVDHQPRLLLRAVAMGIDVIISRESGIGAMAGVTVVDAGDYEALRAAVISSLGRGETKHLAGLQAIG